MPAFLYPVIPQKPNNPYLEAFHLTNTIEMIVKTNPVFFTPEMLSSKPLEVLKTCNIPKRFLLPHKLQQTPIRELHEIQAALQKGDVHPCVGGAF